jgi:hypothetical protein
VDVESGQVGQRPLAALLVLDQPRTTRPGRDERMAAQQRLQLGLLVGTDDVIARVQPPPLPTALIEVQGATGLLTELRIARKDPRAPRPRPDRVL